MVINEIIIGIGDIAMSAEKRSLLALFLALITVAPIGIAKPSKGILEPGSENPVAVRCTGQVFDYRTFRGTIYQ